MKLRLVLPLFLTGALAVSAVTVWLAIELREALDRVAEAQDRRFQSILLADELRQSSDDLTRFARMFVQTGDERFEEYFWRVLAIRNGEVPRPDGYEGIYWDLVIVGNGSLVESGLGEAISLQDRMVRLGFTEAEFNLLAEAQRRSDSLTDIENRAFNAVRGLYKDGNETYTAAGPPDRTLAQDLLHGNEYLRAKASIMEPIGQFQEQVNSRTAMALVAVQNDARALLLGTFVAAGGLLGLLLMLSVLIHRKVLVRSGALAEAAERITAGDLDVRSLVRGKDELGVLGTTFDEMVSRLADTLTLVTAAKARMEKELNVAREIQMSMIPLTFPPYPDRTDIEIFGVVEPAREVGGDFFDFFFVDDHQLCFSVGDVSGKGVPAALFMTVTRALLEAAARGHLSPSDTLSQVNEQLCRKNVACMFVTIFFGLLDLRNGKLIFTNAGHNPPYLKRREGPAICLSDRHGPAIGALEGAVYNESEIDMGLGDQIFLYTDGVTEAMEIGDMLFGQERLEELLAQPGTSSPQQLVGAVIDAVADFQRGREPADDVTALAIALLETYDVV